MAAGKAAVSFDEMIKAGELDLVNHLGYANILMSIL